MCEQILESFSRSLAHNLNFQGKHPKNVITKKNICIKPRQKKKNKTTPTLRLPLILGLEMVNEKFLTVRKEFFYRNFRVKKMPLGGFFVLVTCSNLPFYIYELAVEKKLQQREKEKRNRELCS